MSKWKGKLMTSKTYKYSLDKSPRKYICPSCQKKRLVRFIDIETGETIDGKYGRCDRSDNCGYYLSPPIEKYAYLIDFEIVKSISDKSFRVTDKKHVLHFVPKSQVYEVSKKKLWISEWWLKKEGFDFSLAERKPIQKESEFVNVLIKREPEEITPPSYHSIEVLNSVVNSGECNLSSYLSTRFESDEVQRTFVKYKVGKSNHFWKNSTCFFQVDLESNIRAGKVMQYSRKDGKRIKSPFPKINWMHNTERESNFNLSQCLFGLHLLKDSDRTKIIAVVESEKTALVMSMINNNYIYLACGSKTSINERMLNPVKDRRVILYPDKGSAEDWKGRAVLLNEKGFNITVSTIMEDLDELPDGSDLADLHC